MAERNFLFPVQDNCLTDEEVFFDWEKLNTRFLHPRTGWMVVSGEFLRFSVPESRIYEKQVISLQGWKVSSTFHALLREYGLLFKVDIAWGDETIPLRVVSIANNYYVEEFPFAVDTGDGLGFLISSKFFETFRDNAKEEVGRGQVEISRRLLFLCMISRSQHPDLTVEEFSKWSPFMVNAQIKWWAQKEEMCGWLRVSGEDAGLEDYPGAGSQSVVEIGRVFGGGTRASVGEQDGCVIMWEHGVEAEPVKRPKEVFVGLEEEAEAPAAEPVAAELAATPARGRDEESGKEGAFVNSSIIFRKSAVG